MEFRTSELSGILLSISEPTGFPALSLELFNGNVGICLYESILVLKLLLKNNVS